MLNNQEIQTPVLIEDLGTMYPTEASKQKKRFGIYKCMCNNVFKACSYDIRNGNTKSCGCLSNKHNLVGHRLYSIWRGIKKRTLDKNNKDYSRYGGAGISICTDWEHSFICFYEWAIGNGYDDSLTIDRIDGSGNYEPSNCRWVGMYEQSINKPLIIATNTSGYKGVTYNKNSRKWQSCITVKSKPIYLGIFENAIDAAIAYDSYVIKNNLPNKRNLQ